MAIELGTAYLSVVPSTRGFGKALSAQVGASSAGMAAAGTKAGSGFGKSMAAGAGATMGPRLARHGRNLGGAVGGVFGKTGRSVGERFGATIAESAGAALGRATGAISAGAQKVFAGVQKVAKVGAIAVGATAGAAILGGVKSAMDQQNAETVLGGLYGSAKKAREMMTGLREATKSSPIEYSAYTKAAQSLAYAGVEGKKSTKILKNIGLVMAAAGGGSEEMGRATDAILKMVNNGGKAQLDTLNQLSQTGVPVFDALATKFGKGSDEIRKMASDGKISVTDVLSVIENKTGKYMKSMTKAGGAAEKTFSNSFKAIKDNVTTSIGAALVPLLKAATPLLARMGKWLETAIPAGLKSVGNAASTALPYLQDMATALFKGQHGMGPFAVGSPVIEGLLSLRRNAIGAGSAVRDVLGTAFDVVRPHLSQFGQAMSGVFVKLGPLFGAAFGILKTAAKAAVPYLKVLGVVLGVGLVAAMKVLPPVLSVVVSALTKMLQIMRPLTPIIVAAAAAFAGYIAATKIAAGATAAYNAVTSIVPALQYSMAAAQRVYTAAINGGTTAVKAKTLAERLGLVAAKAQMAVTGAMSAAQRAYTAATNGTALATVRAKVAAIGSRIATVAGTAATWAMTVAQRALNLAMRMNPIGLVISALVLLGIGLVALWKKSETFRRIVTAAWNGIKAAASAVVSWFTGTAWPFLSKIFSWIGSKASWLYRNAIAPAWRGIRAVVGAVVSWFTKGVWPALRNVFGWIGSRVKWLATAYFKVYFTVIRTVARGVINFFSKVVWPVFRNVFGWIAGRAKWLYTNGIRPAFTWIKNVARSLYNFFRITVWGSLSKTFSAIASKAKWLYTSGVRPAFSWIQEKIGSVYRWFRDTAAKVISTTLGGIRKAFSAAKTAIGKTWNGIKNIVKKPISAVIGFINKPLISGINKILPKNIPSIPGFAGGGSIRGPWRGATADNVLGVSDKGIPTARVNPREYIHPWKSVKHYGTAAMDLVRRRKATITPTYKTGGQVGSYFGQAPGFAKGGLLGGLPRYAKGGQTWPQIWNYVRSKFPGVRMTSNYRPGARSAAGPVSSHALGTAIDIGGSVGKIKQVMSHMASNFGKNMRDLIYSPLWGGKMIYNGKWINAPAVTKRMHYNHGHIGLKPGKGLGGAGLAGVASADGGFDLIGPFKKAIEKLTSKFGGSPLSKAPVEFVKSKMSDIGSWVSDKVGAFTDFFTGGARPPKGAMSKANLIATIRVALRKVGLDPGNSKLVAATYRRAMQESNGDPAAQNNWDSNAKRGTPSQGLMQVVGPTFRAYKMAGHGNVWNPLDNLIASMRYALARYGSLTKAYNRKGGYAQGGQIPAFARGGTTKPGLSWVGENGPELISSPGGQRVYTNTESQRMVGQRPVHIEIHGVPTDNANEVVRQLTYEIDRRGRYVGV